MLRHGDGNVVEPLLVVDGVAWDILNPAKYDFANQRVILVRFALNSPGARITTMGEPGRLMLSWFAIIHSLHWPASRNTYTSWWFIQIQSQMPGQAGSITSPKRINREGAFSPLLSSFAFLQLLRSQIKPPPQTSMELALV